MDPFSYSFTDTDILLEKYNPSLSDNPDVLMIPDFVTGVSRRNNLCFDNVKEVYLGRAMKSCCNLMRFQSGPKVIIYGGSSELVDIQEMFCVSGYEEVEFKLSKSVRPRNMSGMFQSCQKLKRVKFNGLDTSLCEDFSHMFEFQRLIEDAELQSLRFDSAKCVVQMLHDCGFKNAELNMYTNNPLDMYMFAGNFNGDTISIKGNVKASSTQSMFRQQYLKKVDISGLDTSYQVNSQYMFYLCKQLEEVKGEIKLDNARTVKEMFSCCLKLKDIDIQSISLRECDDMSQMFRRCESLERVDFSGVDKAAIPKAASAMFSGCRSLKYLNLGNLVFKGSIQDMFSNCGYSGKIDLQNHIKVKSKDEYVFQAQLAFAWSSVTEVVFGKDFSIYESETYERSNIASTECGPAIVARIFQKSGIRKLTFYGRMILKSESLVDSQIFLCMAPHLEEVNFLGPVKVIHLNTNATKNGNKQGKPKPLFRATPNLKIVRSLVELENPEYLVSEHKLKNKYFDNERNLWVYEYGL